MEFQLVHDPEQSHAYEAQQNRQAGGHDDWPRSDGAPFRPRLLADGQPASEPPAVTCDHLELEPATDPDCRKWS